MFIESLKWAFAQNLTLDVLSEASCRLKSGKLLATNEGTQFSRITEESIGIFSMVSRNSLDAKLPPQHIEWHQAIYQNNAHGAVLYCHPAAALTAARRKTLPDPDLLLDAKLFMGDAKLVEPDTKAILENMGNANLLLVPGYGLIAVGENISEAVTRAAIFTRLCETSCQLNLKT